MCLCRCGQNRDDIISITVVIGDQMADSQAESAVQSSDVTSLCVAVTWWLLWFSLFCRWLVSVCWAPCG